MVRLLLFWVLWANYSRGAKQQKPLGINYQVSDFCCFGFQQPTMCEVQNNKSLFCY
jgi:hypothetical protein